MRGEKQKPSEGQKQKVENHKIKTVSGKQVFGNPLRSLEKYANNE